MVPLGLANVAPADAGSVPSVTIPPALVKFHCCAGPAEASRIANAKTLRLVAILSPRYSKMRALEGYPTPSAGSPCRFVSLWHHSFFRVEHFFGGLGRPRSAAAPGPSLRARAYNRNHVHASLLAYRSPGDGRFTCRLRALRLRHRSQ